MKEEIEGEGEEGRSWVPLTISMPEKLLQQLDYVRHDVNRSKYITEAN